MLGNRQLTLGLLAGLLMTGPALAAPEVTVLGGGSGSDDPVVACGEQAASRFETGRNGRGLDDDQIFIDAAIASCEAALAAAPQSASVQTWLARAYILAGRSSEAAVLLQSASDAGNPFAAYLLADLASRPLAFGGLLWQDSVGGLTLLQQSAELGFAPAQADLAARYESGNGVPGDYIEAKRLYQLAADQNHGFATYKLGEYEHGGYFDVANYARARELYERAANLGEPLGNNGIGQLYEFGQGVDQDYARAAEYYQLAADVGEKVSQTSLAYLYERGLGVPQDFDKSFALLTDASGQGWGFAHAALSIHYLFGQGTPVDEVRGYELAWAAQGQGVVYAEGILGYLFQNGIGTNRDLANALVRYQAGANGGDQYSADQIPLVEAEMACLDAAGSPHERGVFERGKAFVDIDPASAIPVCENAVSVNPLPVGNRVWLGRAYLRAGRYGDALPLIEEGAAAGNALASVIYGDLLLTGDGVEPDPARAVSLFEAVAQDFGPAQLALGMAYANGTGIPADRNKALEWLRRAENFGVDEAAEQIALLLASPGGTAIDLTGFGREGPAY